MRASSSRTPAEAEHRRALDRWSDPENARGGRLARSRAQSDPFHPGDPARVALGGAGIEGIVDAFDAAVRRARAAGFKVVEIHAAHG